MGQLCRRAWPNIPRGVWGAHIAFGIRTSTFGGGRIGSVAGVPVTKCLWRGNADVREGDDAGGGRQVGHRVDFFAAAEAQDGSADEEERYIGADLGGDSQTLRRTGRSDARVAEFAVERKQCGGSVGGPRTHSALDGEALFNMDGDFGGGGDGVQCEADGLEGGVAIVAGDSRDVAGERDASRC